MVLVQVSCIDQPYMDQKQQGPFDLLERFENGSASAQDLQQLEAWYGSFESEADYTASLSQDAKITERENLLLRVHTQIAKERQTEPRKLTSVTLWKRWIAAASILIAVSAGGYFLLTNKSEPVQLVQLDGIDFNPGSNKAILTLSSGKQISIDDAEDGKLASEGGTEISKTNDGQVVYNGDDAKGKAMDNTMTTPRGALFHMVLSDGTGVWLNAASSITYPVHFNGNNREVRITGEVYFQVAHNAAKPFHVISNGQSVEVLGTHFNINAYDNEQSVKTTLLEGSVKVASLAPGNEKNGVILKPGQQSSLDNNILKVATVQTHEIMAWKDGFFDFTDADIRTVMRQFARWYDVDIQFEGPVTSDTFTGRLPRSLSLSRVMGMMQSSKAVKLTVEGRRIVVK